MYVQQIAETLSLSDTAEMLGVSKRTLQRWIKAGKFIRPLTPDGMHPRFLRSAVREWMSRANRLQAAYEDLAWYLDALAHDPKATLRERRWAASRLQELRSGDPDALVRIQAEVA